MQPENTRAVEALKDLGYPLINIRKAMHKLTGVSQPDMARLLGKSRQNITMTINGDRSNPELQRGIADIWAVPVDSLFEDLSSVAETKIRKNNSGVV